MTELLFRDDAYLLLCNSTIVAVHPDGIILDKTLFYPGGGGQPCDKGHIKKGEESVEVTSVSSSDNRIVHHISGNIRLKPGDIIECVLDWKHRYKLMRSHTAAHILSTVIHKETGALITGNQKEIDKVRIDFNLETFDKEKIAEYIEKANLIVKQNLNVANYYLQRDEAFKIESLFRLKNVLPKEVSKIRIVDIAGFDIQACGGTHVRSTSEIGPISFLEMKNKGKDNKRIYFTIED